MWKKGVGGREVNKDGQDLCNRREEFEVGLWTVKGMKKREGSDAGGKGNTWVSAVKSETGQATAAHMPRLPTCRWGAGFLFGISHVPRSRGRDKYLGKKPRIKKVP